MNLRSRLTGIATGDQAMFVTRAAFDATGGFPDIAADGGHRAVARGSSAKARRFACVQRVTTSGRRWERHGVLRTILLMWRLRLAYSFGAEPAALARRYGYVPRDG